MSEECKDPCKIPSGKRGPRGPQGPKGPQGPTGPAGPSGLSVEPLVIFRRLDANIDFDIHSYVPAGSFNLPFDTVSNISILDISIPEDGDYLVHLDFSVVSTYDLVINYGVNVNATSEVDSIKAIILDGNTPPTNTDTYTLDYGLSSLESGDVVKIDFKTIEISGGGSPSTGAIFITMASLTLTKTIIT